MSIQLFLILSTLLLTVCTNLFLLYVVNQKSSERSIVHTFFSLHIASIVGWAVTISMILILPQITGQNFFVAGDVGYWIEKCIFLFGALLLSTNFWFAYVFIYERVRYTLLTCTVALFQALIFILCLVDNIFYTAVTIDPAGYALLDLAPLNGIYALFLLLHLVIPIGILTFGFKGISDTRRRKQVLVLVVSYALFLLISILLNWILPVYFGIFTFNALGPTVSLFLVFGITYTIIKHKFLDIRLVIQRGLIYTILLTFIILVYVTMLNILDIFFEQTFAVTDFINGLVTTIVGILTVPRIDSYLRRKTDSWFFKDGYNYNQAVYDLATSLQSSLNLDTLLESSATSLANILRATSVRILPKSAVPEMAHTEITVPIVMHRKVSGYILVGPKLSGDAYTDVDRQLLETFAAQAGTAMARAFLYQEIKRYAAELEDKVADRTVELQSLQEQQRDMMLHISHELQTPLAVLQTQLEEMKQGTQNQEKIATSERTLGRLSQFIQDLLRLAQLEQQPERESGKPVSLAKALTEAIEEIEIIAASKNISITTTDFDQVAVCVSARDLHEIIMNLASNAIKYMKPEDKSHQSITFSTEIKADLVAISVSDTGRGISDAEQKNLFKSFYRAENSVDQAGTGLGLAITKKLVERNLGIIEITSEIDVGTTVTVSFPVAPAENM